MQSDKKIFLFFFLCCVTIQNGVKSESQPNITEFFESYKSNSSGNVRNDGSKSIISNVDSSANEMTNSIQLGIKHSLNCPESELKRDMLMHDFVKVKATWFPSAGSQTNNTPPHSYTEFSFQSYAPVLYEYFRKAYNISCTDYETSCCNSPLKELSNPGASGAKFFLTSDDKYFMKTLQLKESKFLKKLLPGYYLNIIQNKKTLLPKFFGLYRYQYTPKKAWSNFSLRSKNKNIRLVTMNNFLPTHIKIEEKYDLKGSTHQRQASSAEKSKKTPTYKDLDFKQRYPQGFRLEPHIYAALVYTLERDCRVLESFEIMDYSLLIGVHYPKDDVSDFANKPDYGFNSEKSLIKGIPATRSDGTKLLLFVGIIDILQSYGLRKKAEYSYKAIRHDGRSISVQRPEFYAIRFLKFLTTVVFKANEFNEEHKLAASVSSPGLCSNGLPFYMDNICAISLDEVKDEKIKKLGHRREENGEITYKKINTYQIMNSIQMGIMHTLGCANPTTVKCDLIVPDFVKIAHKEFPRRGTTQTPPHALPSFIFKSYAPAAFRHFRRIFGINNEDYQKSLCSSPLIELSNPGASGSIFFRSQDGNFIMKTVQTSEGRLLQKLLPGYYMNLNQNESTLLPKFFGLYRYQCSINNYWTNVLTRKNRRNIKLVAMNNLFPANIKLHEKYDLKGSTHKRSASEREKQKSSPTYKDLDFRGRHSKGFFLDAKEYSNLTATMERDCRVLASFKIMDYSLLMGVHYIDSGQKSENEKDKKMYDEFETVNDGKPQKGILAKTESGKRVLLFLGIIDILQSFRFQKRVEHFVKATLYEGDTVSVVQHDFYADRFLNFMSKFVFKSDESSETTVVK